MADVSLRNVSKNFGKTQAVSELTLDIANGEFVVLLGPTGAGKTTTLRLAAGLEKPTVGQVLINGQDVTAVEPAARDVTFVFQQYSLYPHLSVYDNLAFPLRSPMRRVPEDQIRKRVQEVAALLRIEDKLQNMATRLSAGRCSALPSAAHWCGSLPSTSWMSRSPRSTPSSGANCVLS